MNETIGFIGLGNMGKPMVLNLLESGFGVKVYNRTAARATEVVAAGAQQMRRPSDVVTPGGVVITMVANDQALEDVVYGADGFGETLGTEGIHLSMSTVSPETSRKLSQYHQQRGSHYVASPVFGRPESAAARKLVILSSGCKEAKERVRPIHEALGQRIFDIGENPAGANIVKLNGNFMIAAAMEAMSEAFNLGEKSGIDRQLMADVYSATIFDCPVYHAYGQRIAKRVFEPAGFLLSLGLKDCNLVLEEANLTQTPMPFGHIIHDRLLSSVAKGRQNQDWSAFTRISSEEAGLESPDV